MTETSCLIAGTQEGDNTSGHVGSPSPACGKHLTPNYQIQVHKFLIPVGHGYLTIFLFSIPFGSIHHARTFILYVKAPCINMV
jgi:hypothetical protein